MPDVNLKVGPQDPFTGPDSAARLTDRYGVANNSLRLLRRQEQNQPVELMQILARPIDDRRTKLIEQNLDLVEEVTGVPNVKGASVRGEDDARDEDRDVPILYITESGRSVRAAVAWSEFPTLIEEHARRERARLGLRAAAVAADPDELEPGEDAPLTAEDAAELRKLVAKAEQDAADAAELRERLAKLEEDAATPEEPFEGAADATVDDVKAEVEQVPEGIDREVFKREVRAYEQETRGDKARAGVLEATEPVELVPAAPSDE